jgi:hypothetical protein
MLVSLHLVRRAIEPEHQAEHAADAGGQTGDKPQE